MSVSTLPNYFTKDKRLLLVEEQKANNEISLMTLPNHFQSISCVSLQEMIQKFDHQSELPDAILVNLNTVSLSRIKPILENLSLQQPLNQIPIIGLRNNISTGQRQKLLELGFSDCFCRPLDWEAIEKRVKFLNKYKEKLTLEKSTQPIADQPFQMPRSKRLFDIFVATTVLLALSPILLLIALLIKIESKGNVFYYSKRVGTGYQVFDFIKFRSMQTGADAKLMNLAKSNSYAEKGDKDKNCTFYKIKDDPRVTRIGKFIRKTSIDELPQLINVLRGEMSIVGNRPLPLYEAQKLTCDDWSKRFMAPAGLTGLWQVDKRGKDNLEAAERIRLDVNYAENYSFLLDLEIMMKTLPAMVQRD